MCVFGGGDRGPKEGRGQGICYAGKLNIRVAGNQRAQEFRQMQGFMRLVLGGSLSPKLLQATEGQGWEEQRAGW